MGWASVLRSSCWQWPNYGLGRESDWSKKLGNGFVRWSVYPQARPAISILMWKEWKGRRYFWLRIITIGKQAIVIFSLKTVYRVATAWKTWKFWKKRLLEDFTWKTLETIYFSGRCSWKTWKKLFSNNSLEIYLYIAACIYLYNLVFSFMMKNDLLLSIRSSMKYWWHNIIVLPNWPS